jgi:hypothetical protein
VVSFTPRPLYTQGKSPRYRVVARAVLDTVVKRKIPSPRRESNPRAPIVQPVAYDGTVYQLFIDFEKVYDSVRREIL